MAEVELSVIILGVDAGNALQSQLDQLRTQTLPAGRFEVLVMATGLQTPELPSAPYRLRLLPTAGAGPAEACNAGVREAAAPYCLILDCASSYDPGLLAEHLCMQQAEGGAVGVGRHVWELPENADGVARAWVARWNAGEAGLPHPPPARLAYLGNIAMPRQAFLATGGLDPTFGRQAGLELVARLEQAGVPAARVPGAVTRRRLGRRDNEILRDAERTGMEEAVAFGRAPELLERLRLAQFSDTSLRGVLMRRLLLRLGVPVRLLAGAAPLLGRRRWAQEYYDFLVTYGYWRGVRRGMSSRDAWQRLIHSPVILMYHAVGAAGERPGAYRVPEPRFRRQLAWLKKHGYPVLRLDDLLDYRYAHRLPPPRSVVLTFDDGYRDNGELAYPVLRKAGFPATIFVVTQAIGGTNNWDRQGELAGRPLLSWTEMREFDTGLIQIGAHTRTHPPLTGVDVQRLEEEVAGARVDIERELGVRQPNFAYPHGKFDARVADAVERAGFRSACCSLGGFNEPAIAPFALRRVEVKGTDSFLRFVLAVWLGMRIGQGQLLRSLLLGR